MVDNLRYLLRRTLEAFPAIIIFSGFVITYIDVPPVFDAKLYYDCLRHAAHHPFAFDNFLCFEHPSFLFIGLFSIPEYFFPSSLVAMHLCMLFLACASFIALSSILFLLFPEPDKRVFRIVSLLLFATQPVLIANVVGFILDLGVLFFGMMFLSLLLHKRYVAASAAGLMLVFTKEPGLFFYISSLILLPLLFLPQNCGDIVRTVREFLKKHSLLLVPIILFVAYVGIRTVHQKSSVLLLPRSFIASPWRTLTFQLEIFVLQFRWFSTAVTAIGLVFWIRRIRRRTSFGSDALLSYRRIVFLILLLILNAYFLTQGIPWNNLRYFLVPLTLGVLVFIVILPQAFSDMRLILVCLVMMLTLNVVAIFRSSDPVSRWLIGTFPFGTHRLYAMGMVDADGKPATGRDQLVYNLEFLKLLELQEEIFRWIRPDDRTMIVGQDGAYYYYIDSWHLPVVPLMVDAATFRFTESSGGIRPVFTEVSMLLRQPDLPEILYYIESPNLAKEDFNLLQETYDVLEERIFDGHGYRMRAFKMKKKAIAGLGSSSSLSSDR